MALRFLLLILAPLTGALPANLLRHAFKKWLKYILAFSGGMMLTLLCLHLLPYVFTSAIPAQTVGLLLLLGFGFQILLEHLTMGAEHGHVHLHAHQWRKELWLVIGMSIHSVSDGLPLGIHAAHFNLVGYLGAIAIHKIPEGFILMMLFNQLVNRPYKAWLLMITYACISPLTMLMASQPAFTSLLPYLLAFVSGGLFHVSATILFENNPDTDHHRFNAFKWMAIISGSLLAIVL
jgi:zinc transporter ZupT